jgi:Cu2+-exporting ATPase
MAALTLSNSQKRRLEAERIELLVRGARCANCVAKIESGVRRLDGVCDARLNLSTGKLTVQAGGSIDPQAVIRQLDSLGYAAWPFDPGKALSDREHEGRALLIALAVSGFGVAFVVGLTDTLWYGASDMGAGTRTLISWIAALVASPTALFAGATFFRSAIRSLKVRRANMDVPISLAILFSLGLSFYESFSGGERTYFDAAVMLPFLLLIGRYLDFLVRQRASDAAGDLVAMQAVSARRLRDDGSVETVRARDIVPGNRIVLAVGERSPVDGTVIEGNTSIDVSLLSGETAPVAIRSGERLQAGAIILDRPITLLASHALENSLVAKIGRLIEAGQQARNSYVRLADKAAGIYVPAVHGLALSVFVAWLFVPHAGVAIALRNGISLLIITCPCALGLAVPAVQVVATGLLFRCGMLVKSGDALERLAEVDVAVFDKTGTLTEGKPTLLNETAVPTAAVRKAAMLARASRHPLAIALAAAAGTGPVSPGACEIEGCGIESCENGTTYRLGRASFVGADPGTDSASELWFRDGSNTPIRFRFADGLRPDAQSTLRELKRRGVAVEILSGDRHDPVANTASQTDVEVWIASADPIAKTAHLKSLRDRARRVLMVGDGLNDAASLALANVSISPGTALDATQANADMVFQGRSLWPIAQAVVVSRTARRRMIENFAFAAAYNTVAVPLAALGLVTPLIAAIAMASSSLLVTLNALRQSVPERS